MSHKFFFTPIYLTKIRAKNGQFSYGLFFHPFLQAYYYVEFLDTENKFIYSVQFFFQKAKLPRMVAFVFCKVK